jgi:hypothetical protein
MELPRGRGVESELLQPISKFVTATSAEADKVGRAMLVAATVWLPPVPGGV